MSKAVAKKYSYILGTIVWLLSTVSLAAQFGQYTTNLQAPKTYPEFATFQKLETYLKTKTPLYVPMLTQDEIFQYFDDHAVYMVKSVSKRNYVIMAKKTEACRGESACNLFTFSGEKSKRDLATVFSKRKMKRLDLGRDVSAYVEFRERMFNYKLMPLKMYWQYCGMVYLLQLSDQAATMNNYEQIGTLLVSHVPHEKCQPLKK